MKTIEEYFEDYGGCHQTEGNQLTHLIGIPIILIGLLGLLARLGYAYQGIVIDVGQAFVFGAVVFFYARIHLKMAIVMAITLTIFYICGRMSHLYLQIGLFVVGWILQFVGHSVYEKQKPAFFSNLVHLLVGPMWIVNKAIKVVKVPTPQPES